MAVLTYLPNHVPLKTKAYVTLPFPRQNKIPVPVAAGPRDITEN